MNIDNIIREEIRLLKEVTLDVNKLGDALADVESGGGDYKATNPKSSAAGKYQFLWNTWGKEIERVTGVSTKQEFLDSPQAQEKFFKYYVNNELKPQVAQLKSDSTKSDAALAALVHFQGPAGAKRYLKTGKEVAPEINMSVEKYLDRVETAYYGSTQNNSSEKDAKPEPIDPKSESDEQLIDKIQTFLDFAGFIPFIGDALDLINGIIYVIRGRYIDALLSAIAIIPGVGSAVSVPLRVAFKAAKKTMKSGAFKLLVRGGKPFQKFLISLIEKGKLDANLLEIAARSGDDVAKMIQDASNKVKNVPGGSKISKYADEYIDIVKKRLDDMAEAIKKSKVSNATVSDLAKKTAKEVLRNRALPKAIRFMTRRALTGKLVRGVTSTGAIKSLRKTMKNKFIDQVSKNPKIIKNILGKLDNAQINSLAKFLKVSPNEVQKLIKNTKSLKPSFTKDLIKHMTDNKKIFSTANQSFKRYQKAYVEQGLSQIKNLSFKRGAGKFLFNTSDRLWSNLSWPKLVTKSVYLGQVMMEDGENPKIKEAGKDLKELGEEQARLYSEINLSEPGDDDAEKEIMNQRDEVERAQQKADQSLKELESIEQEELSEEDQKLLTSLVLQFSEE